MQNLANNLVYHGDTEEADRIFSEIIRLQPDSPQAHWALATSRRKHAATVTAVARLASASTAVPMARCRLMFSMR